MTFVTMPVVFLAHSAMKDGETAVSIKDIAAGLASRGYEGAVLTLSANEMPLGPIFDEAEAANTADFAVVPGRSLVFDAKAKGADGCELSAISGPPSPPLQNIESKNLSEALKQLKNNSATAVWAHPWSCKNWLSSVASFNGIELFNDSQEDEEYASGRETYLGALKKGANLFVVSGTNTPPIQATSSEYITYVFPDYTSRDSLLAALKQGRTIATFNSKLFYLNTRPSLTPARVESSGFVIEASIGIKPDGIAPAIKIYKNGAETSPAIPATLKEGAPYTGGFTTYDISFGDRPAPGSSACYVFEIPRYMFSSPFCFTTK